MRPGADVAVIAPDEPPAALERGLRRGLGLTGPIRQLDVRVRRGTVLRLLETDRGRIWAKAYRRSGHDARQEYEFLRFAEATLDGSATLAVPKPLAHLPPATVAIADVDGVPLRDLLARGSPVESELAVRRCSAWLAALHAAAAAATAAADAAAPAHAIAPARTAETFDMTLAARFVGCNWPDLERSAAELAAAATDWDRHAVVTHGDFAPHNVLVAPERVTVLDPSFHREFGRRPGRCSRHEDLARFWVSLRGVAGPERRDPRRRALANAFLEAYADGSEPRTPGFELFTIVQAGLALRDWSDIDRSRHARLLATWLASEQ
jgi:Ser/Thr protein kinase RdoA (MazF antagonist)